MKQRLAADFCRHAGRDRDCGSTKIRECLHCEGQVCDSFPRCGDCSEYDHCDACGRPVCVYEVADCSDEDGLYCHGCGLAFALSESEREEEEKRIIIEEKQKRKDRGDAE